MTGPDPRLRLPVSINGFRFSIDADAYRRIPIESTRQLNDQTGEVGEQTLNSPYLWKRTQDDWRFGAGQEFFDVDENASRARFRDSIGIDPWGQRDLRLLNTVEFKDDPEEPGPTDAWLFVVGGQLVYAKNLGGEELTFSIPLGLDGSGGGTYTIITANYSIAIVNNPAASTWTFTEIEADLGTIESLASDGSSLYVKLAGTNQLRRIRITGTNEWTISNIGDNTNRIVNLRIVAGRLIGQKFGLVSGGSDLLVEVKASSQTTIATYEAGQMPVITGAVNGPSGIYITGITRRENDWNDWTGVQSGIFRIQIDDTSGALTVPAPVASLPDGEAVLCALAYSGYFVLGTSAGVRLARWTATGGVEYGPVIEITSARDTVTNTVATRSPGNYVYGVCALEGDGPYVWFSWSSKSFTKPDGTDGAYTGTGRLNLARFVGDLQPAYASDLMTEGSFDAPVRAITSYDGRRYYVIQATGPYGETTTKLPLGHLATGQINYGTAEDKRLVNVELRSDKLPEGSGMAVLVRDEFGDAAFADTHAGPFATQLVAPIDDVAGDSAELLLTLGRAWDSTVGPSLRRWTLRALPIPDRQEEIWLPIRLHDQVGQTDTGLPVTLDIHAEFAKLRALMLARTVTILEMGHEAINVIIDGLYTGADTDVKLTNWNKDESWPEGVWFVKCITV